jgi:2',3'-cyclic-nucleotide 2'-phosphodiesterase (5'-nucleotidase family)
MGRWIAGAIRAETGADVAIVNATGLRQSLPRGPVTQASVWSILPFDNRVIVVRLDGDGLLANLRVRGAVSAGATRHDDGRVTLADGRSVDPRGLYAVATIDFLYFGGDHFTFQDRALSIDDGRSGADWRDVVINWTKKQRSAEDAPLETLLPP